MRRTTRWPWTCSDAFLLLNAVNGISATSALETQVLVAWSKIASVCLIGVHASSSMVAIAALTLESRWTVTDTSAPARRAAASSVQAPHPGVAVPRALLGVAVDLDDRVVDIDHDPPAASRDHGRGRRQGGQEPGGNRVELADVAEREGTQKRTNVEGA